MASALDIRSQALSRLGFGQPISAAGVVPYGNYARDVNQFMTQEAQKPFVANLPGYLPAISQQGALINQQLKGELPQDVINMIGQQAAERGISIGAPGSPNANTAYLRALGLTSLGQQQQGVQNLATAIQETPVPQLFSPATLGVPGHTAFQELNAAMLGGGGSTRMPGGSQVVASSGPGRAPGMTPWNTGTSTATSIPQFGYPGGGNASLSLPTDSQIEQIANGSLPTFIGRNTVEQWRQQQDQTTYDPGYDPSTQQNYDFYA